MPKVTINGRSVTFATVPSQQEIDYARRWLGLTPRSPGNVEGEPSTPAEPVSKGIPIAAEPTPAAASLSDVRASLRTPEARGASSSLVRPVGRGVGAAVGAGLGLAGGGPAGALLGGIQGAGATDTVLDLLEGTGDWRRAALQGVAMTVPEVSAFGKALTLGQKVIASGLLSGAAGTAYDLVTGQADPTVGGTLERGAQDIAGGMTAATLGGASRETFGVPRQPRASVLPREEQDFRAGFSKAEGIPLSASGRTGSKGVAKLEQLPASVPLGADRATAFYGRQLAAAEDSMRRRLDHIDALSSGASPTEAGEALRQELPELAQDFRVASDQGFKAVKTAFRKGVSTEITPTHWIEAARDVIKDASRAPYPAPGRPKKIVRRNTTQPPPLPVLFDMNGRPLTLDQIAADPRPMSYDQARYYLKQMAARTFKNGQPVIGTVDDGVRKRLWGALNDDLTEMLSNHPEAAELYRWMKRGYADTREVITKRLQPLAQRGELEDVPGRIFRPGKLDRTLAMREVLPRELFEQQSAALARSWYEKATGRDGFSSAKMASQIQPYAQSGQLDAIFEPEVAAYFKDFVRFEPALKSTERLAGNPSGTGQRLLSGGQAIGLAQPLFRPTDPAAYKEAAVAAMPWLLAHGVFSNPGINALTTLGNEGIGPALGRMVGSRPMSVAAGQGIARQAVPPFLEWLGRFGGGAPAAP